MSEEKQVSAERVTFDDMAQDLFGLNIRGLKTIWVLWTRPRQYFEAAKASDWMGQYTPSIRLWISIIAVFSFLQFIWIGSDTPLVSVYAEGFRNAGVIPNEGWTYETMGERAALWIYGITPIFQAVLLVFLALIFPFWGQKTNFALRQRYVFATIVPSATVMLFLVPSMRFMSIEMVSYFGFVIAAISYSVDFITSVRGGFSSVSKWGKAWRAALLAAVILSFNFAATILIQIAGIIMVSTSYGTMGG